MKAKKLLSLVLVLAMVVSIVANITITASAGKVTPQNSVNLDLESSTTNISESSAIDLNYKLTILDPTYTNVNKVKVEWNITDITATRKVSKIWNPDTLSWTLSATSSSITNGNGMFTITNYSAEEIDAKVEFAAKEGFNPTVEYTGVDSSSHKVTIGTVVSGGIEVDSSANHAADVTVNVIPSSADFVNKEATDSSKYGTFTVSISKAEPKVTLIFNPFMMGILTYNGTEYTMGDSFSIKVAKNSVVSIVTEGDTSTLTVDGKTVTQTCVATPDWSVSDGYIITTDMTITGGSCILSGSKVTLADGTTKVIDEVTTDDKLMTFNFYEGKLDGNYPMYIMKHENVLANVITVTLDNGTVLEMCDWQQFFDMDEKTYFDIDAGNYKGAIGRNILFVENSVATVAKITNATKEIRTCTSYEIFTEYNKNFVANGILTVEPETYLQGVYTIGEDLKIDAEQYEQDVKTFGRYTYAEFAGLMTEHEFEVMNIADKKIAVGKGLVSENWLFDLYMKWTPLYR